MTASPSEWVIVGSGILGRQVEASLQACAAARGEALLGYLDDDPAKVGLEVGGRPILGVTDAWLRSHGRPVHVAVAIGNPRGREAVAERIRALGVGAQFTPVINPFSFVGPRVVLEEGVIVNAGCVCQCDLTVGAFTILASCCSLAHDSRVGSYSWLSPGSRLAGYASVGDECWIGMNTAVLPHRKVHDRAETGAGSVIHKDVPEDAVVAGVPARLLRMRDPAGP
ncbi:MAG: hypothetical protein HYZ13_14150 [Acidobacteria bacterium]|nr:hypothetical protein [Acidobacteriota bacterium]